MTELRTVLRAATSRLSEAGIETPRVDAELLAAHALGVRRGRLPLIDTVTDEAATVLDGLVDRRAAREPLQHIVGEAPFLDRLLSVGPGVFVPRPETELLAAWGIEMIGLLARPVAVDLCSGSGALAVAIADAKADAHVYAVERSRAALPWLRRNTEGTSVHVVEGDVTDPAVLHQLDGSVDLVVCNPPYVPAAVGVPTEVSHDPAEAVFAGPDGLDVIPAIISRAASLCRDGGHLGLEHDESQAKVVAELLRVDGRYAEIAGMSDLTGRPRFTIARRIGWRESLPTRGMAG
ncbi:release factor glutamine methyltransferase [Allocatelliglobosispora scoriae]|uniref:Release factor glutamine methyltransferase n=1 Tax=Allocatelliglobosispora scoriae TaxID=643052 RepID=A0A841BZE1_9ACTN|nr:peptide chain release factor N(5)-glutamine methyltransferase [Allocatelliglobosispora scoriae]MBB5872031.1 release factor glutamine methyltransferase [Allocatelliglobosispora scoriae]